MATTDSLILVPTADELEILQDFLPASIRVELCGFGPIAAGIEATRLLQSKRYRQAPRVVLTGIGGTFDVDTLPIGQAASFRHVRCCGVGVGSGNRFLGPEELGIPQLDLDPDFCFDRLELQPVRCGTVTTGLLTTPAAAADRQEARERMDRYPDCVCEDMEGFAVALAATRLDTPVSVIRGVSNRVGDRDHSKWQIRPALEAAARLLIDALG